MGDQPRATTDPNLIAVEHRAMNLTRWANLAMGLVGAFAAWTSNSQALLIDGLLSLIGYVAAVYAMRISKTAHLGPDRERPFGHAAEEALYATFRSLALLGLVLFGIAQAGLGIADYLLGNDVEEIRYVPVAIYTAFVATACFWLGMVHRRAWIVTGKSSVMLRLEMFASFYDGAVTLCAGIGLLSIPFLAQTALAPITPVMDSILVLFLCSLAIVSYLQAFRSGLAQLAGAPASAREQLALRRAVKHALGDRGGRIIDVAAIKLGRKLDTVIYYDPERPIMAAEVDTLTREIAAQVVEEVGPAAVLMVISEADRQLLDNTEPDLHPPDGHG